MRFWPWKKNVKYKGRTIKLKVANPSGMYYSNLTGGAYLYQSDAITDAKRQINKMRIARKKYNQAAKHWPFIRV